ncbi:unnamed protein product [Caenorhabditis auriculariae]|uniref:MHD domain-containing protein n=1 Tax=Caenorhabditis auriculariae TaxID=2777116 RepID=A0A8S1GQS9_9PELO|nr:unnamed protein product [Caenorhabditis auriculariae]
MLNSLFIVNTSGDVILEKHWKSVIHRSICDYFFDLQKKESSPEDVPPIISTPHHYLINVYHNQLYLLAVVTTETPPLMVIEFLHRVIQTFVQYFGECSDSSMKENCVIVFELLDEMLDNGFPLVTELNILQDLIKPPNFLRNIANQVTGRTNLSETLPSGQLSNIPWRRHGVKYTNNEAYFDVIEEIDVILDKQGTTVSSEIQGYVDVCCKLSGMPDLTMTLVNPRLLDDVSFHPCVRYKRWENEKVLSFVPPDGNFRLLSYHIAAQNMVAIPVYVRHVILLKPVGGKMELTVGPKQSMGKMLEDVVLEMTMPKAVQNCNVVPSHGKCSFDPTTKLLHWNIGKIELGKPPTLKGPVSVTGTAALDSPPISIKFKINQLAVSGMKVNRLDMYGEKYKPFKGVKMLIFLLFVALAVSQTEQKFGAKPNIDDDYRFPPNIITIDSIVDEYKSLSVQEAEERNFNGPVLAYVTPWNNRGYDLAKKTTKKLTHIAPVWFQAKPEYRDSKLHCKIEGSHDIDRSWIEALVSNNPSISIVPRILFEGWGQSAVEFLRDSSAQTRCAREIVDFYSRNQFNGAVIEAFAPLLFSTGSLEYREMTYEAMEELANRFKKASLEVIFPVKTPIDDSGRANNLYGNRDFKRLTDISTFIQIETYDYPAGKLFGVSPYDWVAEILKFAQKEGANMKKILMGMNFYGYEFKGVSDPSSGDIVPTENFEHIINNKFLDIVKSGEAEINWDENSWEHYFVHRRSVVYYPTLSSIELRIKLADYFKSGIAIWDYGQGLDYFLRAF